MVDTISSPQIDLGVGWPNPNLLAASGMRQTSQAVFSDSNLSNSGGPLCYGTDEGFNGLRTSIAS